MPTCEGANCSAAIAIEPQESSVHLSINAINSAYSTTLELPHMPGTIINCVDSMVSAVGSNTDKIALCIVRVLPGPDSPQKILREASLDKSIVPASRGISTAFDITRSLRSSRVIPSQTPEIFRLLDLPPEIRKMIYGFASTSNKSYAEPPFLRVCRQIRSEGLNIFYSTHIFKIVAHRDDATHGNYPEAQCHSRPWVEQLISRVGTRNASKIRHLRFKIGALECESTSFAFLVVHITRTPTDRKIRTRWIDRGGIIGTVQKRYISAALIQTSAVHKWDPRGPDHIAHAMRFLGQIGNCVPFRSFTRRR